jgi:tRNA U55 pseudouridine synthase TruB
LKSLVRLSYGPFDIKDAISLPRLEEAFCHGYWTHYVYAIDTVLLHWNAMIVGEEKEKKIANGVTLPSTIDLSQTGDSARARVYTLDGGFLSVLKFDPEKDQWQTNKVFLGSKPI